MTTGIGAEATGEAKAVGVVSGDARDQGKKLVVVAVVELELGSLGTGDDAVDFSAGGFHIGCVGKARGRVADCDLCAADCEAGWVTDDARDLL